MANLRFCFIGALVCCAVGMSQGVDVRPWQFVGTVLLMWLALALGAYESN